MSEINPIYQKYKNITESIENFFKKEVIAYDDFLQNSRCTTELLRLKLIVQKEILFNKKVLNNQELLETKDNDITNNILNDVDFQKATNLLIDFVEKKIDYSDLVNSSMVLDLDYAINKSKSESNLLDFVNLVDKIQFISNKGGMEYSFAKMYIADIKESFDNTSNANFINEVNAKYLSSGFDLNIEEIDCLCDVREFSKKYNSDRKTFDELFQTVNNKKIEEEIVDILKSKTKFGFYNELAFTINDKPYLYKFDIETKSWNRDKHLIDRVLKIMEEGILENIIKTNNIDDLKDFIIVNEKRDVMGQKYISNEDYQKFKSFTKNDEIIALLENPCDLIEKDAPKKRKIKAD